MLYSIWYVCLPFCSLYISVWVLSSSCNVPSDFWWNKVYNTVLWLTQVVRMTSSVTDWWLTAWWLLCILQPKHHSKTNVQFICYQTTTCSLTCMYDSVMATVHDHTHTTVIDITTISTTAAPDNDILHLLWYAPLRVHTAKRRHQSPEFRLPYNLYCVGGDVKHCTISLQRWFWATSIASFGVRLLDIRSCWIVFIHLVWGRPVLQVEAVKSFLASVSSGIRAMWPNWEKRRAWTMAERWGCPVVCLTSSFHTWWYHWIPNSFHKHHCSRASSLSTYLLVSVQPRAIQNVSII